MKTNLICYLLLVLIGISTSCKDDLDANEPIPLGKDPVNFYKDKTMFDEASRLRTAATSSPFAIDHIQRTENTLEVDVSYANGCEGTFHVIWDGSVMLSYPMQAHLIIKFVADSCPTDPDPADVVKKSISIDLVGLMGDEQLVKETIFHVANGSSLQDVSCEGDCNKSVSNG